LRRALLALAPVATILWCLLLFGIGLDDLMNRHTRPGVILSVVVLPFLIVGAAFWLVRLAFRGRVPRVTRRADRRR
jgi:hypothetical protein